MTTTYQLVTVKEALKLLGISRTSLYKWMNQTPPKILSIKYGSARFIPLSEIDRLKAKLLKEAE